ncbi:MAG: ATP-dependent 6-phosphofructokinase [bacterium]
MKKKSQRRIGLLTAGGDCPGLNAAIRAVAKTVMNDHIQVVGFHDGFRGLAENRFVMLDDRMVSGILTTGGTILGTSRDKPHKILMGGKTMDMTDVIVANYRRHQLDCLVCLGGNGTQKNAFRLAQEGLNVVTLPKTIDNDVVLTDTCFGYDTATYIATEAIDRLHTTATSHHRIIAVELMGHSAGWLALGAGIAGGADVILIPEIPYDIRVIAEFLGARRKCGKRFSIIAVAEGARAIDDPSLSKVKQAKVKKEAPEVQTNQGVLMVQEPMVDYIVRQLQALTGIEARTTQLGHVQRGGPPTPTDRLICTRLGSMAGELIAAKHYNVMVGVKADACEAVPLEKVAGLIRSVPTDHSWIKSARLVGTCFGDRIG